MQAGPHSCGDVSFRSVIHKLSSHFERPLQTRGMVDCRKTQIVYGPNGEMQFGRFHTVSLSQELKAIHKLFSKLLENAKFVSEYAVYITSMLHSKACGRTGSGSFSFDFANSWRFSLFFAERAAHTYLIRTRQATLKSVFEIRMVGEFRKKPCPFPQRQCSMRMHRFFH